jgi:hypothetical protein
MAHSTKTSLLHHILHLDPHSRPSKIIHWMYQDQLLWLGINGLDLLLDGCMDNGPKLRSCKLIFSPSTILTVLLN